MSFKKDIFCVFKNENTLEQMIEYVGMCMYIQSCSSNWVLEISSQSKEQASKGEQVIDENSVQHLVSPYSRQYVCVRGATETKINHAWPMTSRWWLFSRQVISSTFATLCTAACQVPLSIGFPRQEYWSGLPFPSPRDLPDPGIEPKSVTSPALAGRFFTTSTTGEVHYSPSSGLQCALGYSILI